jgi:hypothetical protein
VTLTIRLPIHSAAGVRETKLMERHRAPYVQQFQTLKQIPLKLDVCTALTAGHRG